jgi:hypothetical protein
VESKIIDEKTKEIDKIKAEINEFSNGKFDPEKLSKAIKSIDDLVKSLTDIIEKEEKDGPAR